jgi:hypothetical protein
LAAAAPFAQAETDGSLLKQAAGQTSSGGVTDVMLLTRAQRKAELEELARTNPVTGLLVAAASANAAYIAARDERRSETAADSHRDARERGRQSGVHRHDVEGPRHPHPLRDPSGGGDGPRDEHPLSNESNRRIGARDRPDDDRPARRRQAEDWAVMAELHAGARCTARPRLPRARAR